MCIDLPFLTCVPSQGHGPLHVAAEHGHLPLVQTLVATRPSDITDVTVRGQTPLHYAAWKGQEPVLEWLLLNGAQPDVRNTSGRTALQVCV